MAMPQDLVGKVIKYTVTPSFPANPSALRNGVLTDDTIVQSLQLFDVVGAVGGAQGRQIKATAKSWDFAFLKYVPGHVTAAQLSRPILTGPMSGCYLCRFTEDGKSYISHIGTVNTPTDQGTIAAKNAWISFIGRSAVSNVSGASPFDLFPNTDFSAHQPKGGRVPTVLGYFDGTNNYGMLFAQVPSNVPNAVLPGVLQIVSVKPMPLMSWAEIAKTPKFKD